MFNQYTAECVCSIISYFRVAPDQKCYCTVSVKEYSKSNHLDDPPNDLPPAATAALSLCASPISLNRDRVLSRSYPTAATNVQARLTAGH